MRCARPQPSCGGGFAHGRDRAQQRQLTLGQGVGAQALVFNVQFELAWQQQALQGADVLCRGTVARAWAPAQRQRQAALAVNAQVSNDLLHDLDRQLEQGERHGQRWAARRAACASARCSSVVGMVVKVC